MLTGLLLLQIALPAPTWTRPPLPLADPRLSETSALAPGIEAGVFWTLNDSDNPAELFATDTNGRALGRIRVKGATNIDWEALAPGPCPARRPTGPLARCLYIGDIGDNVRKRPWVVIYRAALPMIGRDSVLRVLDSLRVSYPDSARDAEAMVVGARGDLWIVSKELVREPRLYRVRASRWGSRRVIRAEYIATLPIPSPRGIEYWTTDATWGPGGALIVRTYGALWQVPFRAGRPVPARTRPLCSLAGLGPQGEGLAWLGGDLYALTSEKLFRFDASIALVRCGQ